METIVKDLDLMEIINGEEVMGPSPFDKHQTISGNLYDIIRRHVKMKESGRVFYSPLDVIFEEGINRLQPDILFIKKENLAILQGWVRGVPDMVCEIISPGSYERDTEIKRAIYERYRVPEYWLVIPELQIIEILTLSNDKFIRYSFAELSGIVTSKVVDGLQVDLSYVFE